MITDLPLGTFEFNNSVLVHSNDGFFINGVKLTQEELWQISSFEEEYPTEYKKVA